AASLLRLAIEAGLLGGDDGNRSHRTDDGLWTTPPHVDKRALGPPHPVLARVDPVLRRLTWPGPRKPSIGHAVPPWAERRHPHLVGLLHFHEAVVLPTAVTTFPYPCGTLEEAEEIQGALCKAAFSGSWDGGAFSVRLVDHGLLVGVQDTAALLAEWEEARL